MKEIKLEKFQGPLDLLLRLIEGQELDISQVSLAQVTDQYLNYLDSAKNISATELADFLVIATKLLVIKSKILLPQLPTCWVYRSECLCPTDRSSFCLRKHAEKAQVAAHPLSEPLRH